MPFEKGKSGNEEKKFQKGQTGNPNGRPKKLPEINEILATVLSEEVGGQEAATAILKKLREKALKGDLRAIELMLDRAYGRPKQAVEGNIDVSGEIKISYEDD